MQMNEVLLIAAMLPLSISSITAGDDFIPVTLDFTFDSTTLSHCFNISINDDLLVEKSEKFSVSLNTADSSVFLVPLTTVIITDEDGKFPVSLKFCSCTYILVLS